MGCEAASCKQNNSSETPLSRDAILRRVPAPFRVPPGTRCRPYRPPPPSHVNVSVRVTSSGKCVRRVLLTLARLLPFPELAAEVPLPLAPTRSPGPSRPLPSPARSSLPPAPLSRLRLPSTRRLSRPPCISQVRSDDTWRPPPPRGILRVIPELLSRLPPPLRDFRNVDLIIEMLRRTTYFRRETFRRSRRCRKSDRETSETLASRSFVPAKRVAVVFTWSLFGSYGRRLGFLNFVALSNV